jgi:hypothetical protein
MPHLPLAWRLGIPSGGWIFQRTFPRTEARTNLGQVGFRRPSPNVLPRPDNEQARLFIIRRYAEDRIGGRGEENKARWAEKNEVVAGGETVCAIERTGFQAAANVDKRWGGQVINGEGRTGVREE